jgi:hypothetical protein
MALPGFTAEAAVYVSNGHYMGSVGGPVMSGIVPALPSSPGLKSLPARNVSA